MSTLKKSSNQTNTTQRKIKERGNMRFGRWSIINLRHTLQRKEACMITERKQANKQKRGHKKHHQKITLQDV